jgi:hypothetical protein
MALTNNTKFRRVNFTINKKVNGSLQTSGGFPKQHAVTEAFGAFAAITDQQLEVLTEADYTTRLNGFYDFLEQTYSFYNRSQNLVPASGTDATLCPLSNAATPVYTINEPPQLGFFEDGNGGYNLVWSVETNDVVVQDVSYFFDANILDKNANLIRTERLYGIVRQGRGTHSSQVDDGHYIYVPEGQNPLLTPISVEYVNGSAVAQV